MVELESTVCDYEKGLLNAVKQVFKPKKLMGDKFHKC